MRLTPHLDDAVWELALGAEHLNGAHGHLADCSRCRQDLAQAVEAVTLLARALPRFVDTPGRRARVVGEAAYHAGEAALALRAGEIAALFEAPRAEVAAALARTADPAAWLRVLPGFSICLIGQVGESYHGFARAEPGFVFPEHRHGGRERTLVLQGACFDSRAGWLGPGDASDHEPGTEHRFEVTREAPLVFAFRTAAVDFLAP